MVGGSLGPAHKISCQVPYYSWLYSPKHKAVELLLARRTIQLFCHNNYFDKCCLLLGKLFYINFFLSLIKCGWYNLLYAVSYSLILTFLHIFFKFSSCFFLLMIKQNVMLSIWFIYWMRVYVCVFVRACVCLCACECVYIYISPRNIHIRKFELSLSVLSVMIEICSRVKTGTTTWYSLKRSYHNVNIIYSKYQNFSWAVTNVVALKM